MFGTEYRLRTGWALVYALINARPRRKEHVHQRHTTVRFTSAPVPITASPRGSMASSHLSTWSTDA